jgi:hypothetical protein
MSQEYMVEVVDDGSGTNRTKERKIGPNEQVRMRTSLKIN